MLTPVFALVRPDHIEWDPMFHIPLPDRIHVVTLATDIHAIRVGPLPVLMHGRRLERGIGVAFDRLAEIVHAVFDVVPFTLLRLRRLVGLVGALVDVVLVFVAQVPPSFAEEDLWVSGEMSTSDKNGATGTYETVKLVDERRDVRFHRLVLLGRVARIQAISRRVLDRNTYILLFMQLSDSIRGSRPDSVDLYR